ncbi:MAG: multicopper oxidase family protein [Candidatus Tectomicrobia bacterium]|uniref:Multicopper oxidase family protein n=1 Tax=Tectimicrobiota bacterium TaxID=2528274 RepID=A0A933GMN6_UNCTE|nr:multicopper oxidase family protein [Candidatus Tectomicrobia bacterium]
MEDVRTRNLSRRKFMKLAFQVGVGVMAFSAGRHLLSGQVKSSLYTVTGGIREITLEAWEIDWQLAPGKVVKAMAYNGQVPGPEIRLSEGERVKIILKNSLKVPTTIHWHGVDVPNEMDGVPGVTQKAVEPGETYTYEFTALPAGTRWYHTHSLEGGQLDRGLFGPLIIEPSKPDAFSTDRDYTLVLDDWVTNPGFSPGDTQRGRRDLFSGKGMGNMMRGRMRGMMEGMMGMRNKEAHDTMTINGRAYPDTLPLQVKEGELIRLRLINASSSHRHLIHLAGHQFRVSHSDGNPLAAAEEVDAVPIAAGERYDLLFRADRPGSWFLSCLEPGHAEAGERLILIYEGREKAKPEAEWMKRLNLNFWSYSKGKGQNLLPPPSGRTVIYDFVLSGGMMGSDVWTINGKVYPDTDYLRLRKGDLARVRFMNMSMENHPMHLHGQSFRITEVNRQRLPDPLVKDTVDIEAHMGSVEIEFTAQNPGDWFFHCHKSRHMKGGMITLAQIRE